MIFSSSLKLLFVAGLICTTQAATIFNFDNDSIGSATGFTDEVDGLSATFSSTADPGGFVVYTSLFQTLTGNVLGDPGPSNADNLALTIAFNKELSAATFNFATSDFTTASPLTLVAYQNSSVVGSASSSGNFLPGFSFPEGEIAFAGASFNRLVISSNATDFAVDNIAVVAASAPEPAFTALLAIGFLAVGYPSVRSKLKKSSSTR